MNNRKIDLNEIRKQTELAKALNEIFEAIEHKEQESKEE
jgi:hypothetical protein